MTKPDTKESKYYSWGYITRDGKEACYEGSHLDMFHYINQLEGIKLAKINDLEDGHNIEVWLSKPYSNDTRQELNLIDGDFIKVVRKPTGAIRHYTWVPNATYWKFVFD